MFPLLFLAGAVAILYAFRQTSGAGAATQAPQAPLSERREKALAILDAVLPAKYGDANFTKIAPGYKADMSTGTLVTTDHGVTLPSGFTTCGYLPCYVGRALGDDHGITQCGLEQIRTNGKKTGSWVESGDGRLPKPGDFIVLVNDQDVPLHVAVFVSANGDTWKTADAGQGPRAEQEAKYVERTYDPKGATLTGISGKRKLAGWLDLDKYPIAGKVMS